MLFKYSMRSESCEAKSLVISAHAVQKGSEHACHRADSNEAPNTVIVDEPAAQVVKATIHSRFR